MKLESLNSHLYSVKNNARCTKICLDRSVIPDDFAVDSCAEHIKDCIKNPTIGFIAREKYIDRVPKNYPEYFTRNKSMINEPVHIRVLKDLLNFKLKDLYPKTAKIREFIIKDGRLSLDNVTKSKGYSFLDKLRLFCKL